MTCVKICGLTNLDDAQAAVAAGADYLGFIFYPASQRAISVESAGRIVVQLRDTPDCPVLVGVFVNEPAAVVAAILERCRLDLAQLSGDEPAGYVGDPRSPLYGRSYKAIRPTTLAEAEVELEWFRPPPEVERPPSLLLDSYHPALRGGSGQTADWSLAAQLARQVPGLMLAGGLTPANVALAVQQVRPFAVDVASGVEAAPGRKDHSLVRAFVANARGALTQATSGELSSS